MNNSFHSTPISVSIKQDGEKFIVDFNDFDSIIIRPIDNKKDLPELYKWFSMDYAELWGMKGLSFEKIVEIYDRVEANQYDNAYIGELASGTKPLFLFHVYDPNKDTLSQYYSARESDRGTHRIMAPPDKKIPNLVWYVFRSISEFVFSDPNVQRIVDEPNIYNKKYYAACKQAGYRFGKVIELPDKYSQLTILTRESFEKLKNKPPLKKPTLVFRAIWVWFSTFILRVINKVKRICGIKYP